MPIQFQISKQVDKDIYNAFERVQKTLKGQLDLFIVIDIPHIGGIDTRKPNADQKKAIDLYLGSNSQLINRIYLQTTQGNNAVYVTRTPEKISDSVIITDDWTQSLPDAIARANAHAVLLASVRQELKASDLEAALTDNKDDSWSRYRDAQAAVVNSLQQATETLIIQASQKNAELDKARSERFEKLESDLRSQLEQERKALQEAEDQRIEAFRSKEKNLADKEASFETKESHYVARQKQTEQIKQVQAWLNGWNLTKGTEAKRRPIFAIYIIALVTLGLLTVISTWHSYDILKSADDIVKLAWWQWAALWAKSALPLAAFITFMIYFIRWSGDWARQHSEEEFRNRTLLVDIGRASWLLEAVRDAQERDKEIPTELLKELSRNMFSISAKGGDDIHPQAFSDLLLQGLSSVRVKSADGSEVEAIRNGKKK